ncbi:MAG TPA: hypothetical protein VHU85_06010 [Acidimicrobiales bacterium]|jgi:hypothetical protein|nr:hypothetical protein [Acidimicrobiales bacterium]
MTAGGLMDFPGPGTGFPPKNWGRPVHRSGLAGTVGAVVAAVAGFVLFISALIVIAFVFLLAIVTAVCFVALRALIHRVFPGTENSRVEPGRLRPTVVIETTANVILSTGPKLKR